MKLTWRAAYRWDRDDIGIVAGLADSEGRLIRVAKPLDLVDFTPGGALREVTAGIDHASAQQLLEALWSCGLRPRSGDGSTGQLGATERHLDDMRKIAFAKLEIPHG